MSNPINKNQLRNIISNYVIPNLEISILSEYSKLTKEIQFIQNFGYINKNNLNNKLNEDMISLAQSYLIYSTTLENHNDIINYIDAAITIYPECIFPLKCSFLINETIFGISRNSLITNSNDVLYSYFVPEQEKGKFNIIFSTRKAKLLKN